MHSINIGQQAKCYHKTKNSLSKLILSFLLLIADFLENVKKKINDFPIGSMPQSNTTHTENNLLIQDLADQSELAETQCQLHILDYPVPSRTIKPTMHKDQQLTAGLLEGISHFCDSLRITALWRLVLIFLTTLSISITTPMTRRPPKPQNAGGKGHGLPQRLLVPF